MANSTIIGRDAEIGTLDRIYKSHKSEFIAIYGRRRVGKSYLVNEYFKNKILFSAVGTYVKDGDKEYESYRKLQLSYFYDALVIAGLDSENPVPSNWREAFLLLRLLLPFTLAECAQFYKREGLHMSQYEIALGYMAFGGVPFYMSKLRNDLSLTDNIDRLFFSNENIHEEFKDVYAGLYSSKEKYVETVYQLTDFFSLFYLRFIDGVQCKSGMWHTINRTRKFYSWAGETFELLCVAHIP